MSFVLIRIIMSLLPFIKEAFFGIGSKKKPPMFFVMMISIVILVGAFFLQADILKTLYERNRKLNKQLSSLTTSNEIAIKELELQIKIKEDELVSMSSMINIQDSLLKSCIKNIDDSVVKKEGQ